jgi:hypothetical protein
MPEIYSNQWYEALKKLLNENPEVEKNAPRGTFHVLAKIVGDAASMYMPAGEVRNYIVVFADGKCLEYREVEIEPPRKDFNYTFELPASVFEGVAAGLIDLIDAGLKGKVKISGDMRILIRHAELVNVLYDVYSREVDTTWPKGKPGVGDMVSTAATR